MEREKVEAQRIIDEAAEAPIALAPFVSIHKAAGFARAYFASVRREERLRDALEKIADEQKIYKGHGDYEILPALEAKEAQEVARAALSYTGEEEGK